MAEKEAGCSPGCPRQQRGGGACRATGGKLGDTLPLGRPGSTWDKGAHTPHWDAQPQGCHSRESEGTGLEIPHQEESRPGRPEAIVSPVPKREAEVGLVQGRECLLTGDRKAYAQWGDSDISQLKAAAAEPD